MKPEALAKRALALMQKAHQQEKLVIIHATELSDPASGDTLHEFRAVSAADPNGPSWHIVLATDGSPRERPPDLDPLAVASAPVIVRAAPTITIQPDSNLLTL